MACQKVMPWAGVKGHERIRDHAPGQAIQADHPARGQSSKLTVRVRFPSAALEFQQVRGLIIFGSADEYWRSELICCGNAGDLAVEAPQKAEAPALAAPLSPVPPLRDSDLPGPSAIVTLTTPS